ncbi:MAG: hypothetical protein WC889_12765 [Myxococcota bacterium]|jgi:hypothetical protein
MELTNCAPHRLPEEYTNSGDAWFDQKRAAVQACLDKWDSIMNDQTLPKSDREFFAASFLGYMEEIQARSGFGPSFQEGFDELLLAVQTGNKGVLNGILCDHDDIGEVLWAFNEAFKSAKETTGVEITNESDRMGSMFLGNNWSGIDALKKPKNGDINSPSRSR